MSDDTKQVKTSANKGKFPIWAIIALALVVIAIVIIVVVKPGRSSKEAPAEQARSEGKTADTATTGKKDENSSQNNTANTNDSNSQNDSIDQKDAGNQKDSVENNDTESRSESADKNDGQSEPGDSSTGESAQGTDNDPDQNGNGDFADVERTYYDNGKVHTESRIRADGSGEFLAYDENGEVLNKSFFDYTGMTQMIIEKNEDGSFEIIEFAATGEEASREHTAPLEGIDPFMMDYDELLARPAHAVNGVPNTDTDTGAGDIADVIEAYDENGNPVTLKRFKDGGAIQYVYDKDTGLLKEVQYLNSSYVVTNREMYEYDPLGELLYIHYMASVYNYDENGVPVSITNTTWTTMPDGTPLGESETQTINFNN